MCIEGDVKYMAKRFVVDRNDMKITNDIIEIIGSEAHHINVLRKNVGEKILVNEYVIELVKINKEKIEGKILEKTKENGIPNSNITLIQSYLKSDKMDYLVQKAVELGVKNIIPMISKNTVVKLDETDCVKKVERLRKIIKEAIGQCGRTDDVAIENVIKLKNIDLSVYDLVIICHEKGIKKINDILEQIYASQNIAIIIGPEGGLDEQEIKELNENNKEIIVFGERILRAETASIYILSVLDYLLN